MCNCLEKKECCNCLKGGCDCMCKCVCHTGDKNDPCWAFPTMFCSDCVSRRKTVIQMTERAMEKAKQKNVVPSDADIAKVFGWRGLI